MDRFARLRRRCSGDRFARDRRVGAGAACSGITLIELMVVVALVAILAAMAAPNLSDLFINNRLSTAANELVAALNTARSEAMKRGAVVTMRRCGSVDPETGCAAASGKGEDWGGGWFMFVDLNRDRSRDGGEEILRLGQAVNSPLTLYQNTVTMGSAAQNGTIAFCPDGRLSDGNASLAECQGGSVVGNWSTIFIFCYDGKLAVGNRSRSRAILVSREGRVRLASQDASGVPLNETETAIANCTAPKYQW